VPRGGRRRSLAAFVGRFRGPASRDLRPQASWSAAAVGGCWDGRVFFRVWEFALSDAVTMGDAGLATGPDPRPGPYTIAPAATKDEMTPQLVREGVGRQAR